MISPDDIRHLITEYLPATPSYELARAICEAVNRKLHARHETALALEFIPLENPADINRLEVGQRIVAKHWREGAFKVEPVSELPTYLVQLAKRLESAETELRDWRKKELEKSFSSR